MAPTHGKDFVFKLEDSAASTLRDLSSQLTGVEGFDRSNDTHDTTTAGAEGHTYMVGLTDGSITLNGFQDQTASTGTATVLDSLMGLDSITVGWEYGPFGLTAGLLKYSGECVLESVSVSSPVADMVTFTASLKISGNVTVGVWV